MKHLFLSFLVFCFFTSLFAQEGLDFLDKVNDKPKSTITKQKEEPSQTTTKKQTNVVNAVTTGTGKKKKSKKKSKQNQLTAESLPQNTNSVPNTNLTTTAVTEKSIPSLEKQPLVTEEEEVVNNGLWMDSTSSVEPTGLPGFSADLKIGKVESSQTETNPSANKETGKSFFNFSDFFAKYKKAMMILGIIILFAFYRLRSARPGSSSRSYRR
ncbi:hypothetical protein EHQ68_05200 [Leptospira congkakensis]|uniref:Sec region non-globular protein n=1 Tax=Leptospira congkakensis TaxID=2484932 RepID=A0A4Z1AHE0_9LEPT|nr:SRP-less Sec system protein [Leptospira congkakensis]TGL90815.1 hypothetical protein EHQ69_12960 [Leptospira congkakensis]TGL91824.1 hypothetical protein EHQ68_05200 [Leptospira congkakensis]TGL98876.1 hypothetical protein EHQ70_04795 [Leptospira congkakensis]